MDYTYSNQDSSIKSLGKDANEISIALEHRSKITSNSTINLNATGKVLIGERLHLRVRK